MKKCNRIYERRIKRVLDFGFSIMLLVILLPFLIPIILILFLTGENYIFFYQNRVGYKNKKFSILKFATMIKNSSNIGAGSLTLRDDPRILPFGKFLRFSKINEIPQIINVIIGDMAIVGPRPQMEEDFLKYPKHIQSRIYNSRPGITGIGSVVFRDEEKWISNHIGDKHSYYKSYIAPYKGELEIWYQRNLSFVTDLKLVFLTLFVIIYPSNNIAFKVFKSLPKKPDYIA